VTPASFEPTIDYVVVKFPRFAFEKFPQADATLTTQMKSVGEAMAIGRTFKEALQKAIRSLEIDRYGLEQYFHRRIPRGAEGETDKDLIRTKLKTPGWDRLWILGDGIRLGLSIDEIYQATRIDPWFLRQFQEIVAMEETIAHELAVAHIHHDLPPPSAPELIRRAKQAGFSDVHLSSLIGVEEDEFREIRKDFGVAATYNRVDTCGGEFVANTPYLYSTYETECESHPSDRKKIMILGGGPNRIGQGIEFDYCCVHAAFALKEDGSIWKLDLANGNAKPVMKRLSQHSDWIAVASSYDAHFALAADGSVWSWEAQAPYIEYGAAAFKLPVIELAPSRIPKRLGAIY